MNNLVGRRFNRLVVDEMLPKYKMSANGRWLTYCSCTCDCGKQNVIVNASKLKSMHTQSCGCLRKERVAAACKKRCITHGLSDTKAYGVWLSIKDRCYRPTSKAYEYYGGRGISMCEDWENSFQSFYDWLVANGYSEIDGERNNSKTIDRIDVNGNYEPDNCRLVPMTVQANNKRDNRYETYNGETHTISDWARIRGIPYKTFCTRLYRGWTFDRIMTS